jgi:hypothetical protein
MLQPKLTRQTHDQNHEMRITSYKADQNKSCSLILNQSNVEE